MTLKQRRRKAAEEGSILVELALVVPVLMLLVAGMIEVGAAWRDKSTVIQASRQAARVASHLGESQSSDLEAIKAALAVMPTGGAGEGLSKTLEIRKIVIFDAELSAAEIQQCKNLTTNGGINNKCNVYIKGGGTDRMGSANLVIGNFDNSTNDWDDAWEPYTSVNAAGVVSSDRSDDLLTASLLGAYIEAERPMLTNIFPGQQTQRITAETIMRLEPPAP